MAKYFDGLLLIILFTFPGFSSGSGLGPGSLKVYLSISYPRGRKGAWCIANIKFGFRVIVLTGRSTETTGRPSGEATTRGAKDAERIMVSIKLQHSPQIYKVLNLSCIEWSLIIWVYSAEQVDT